MEQILAFVLGVSAVTFVWVVVVSFKTVSKVTQNEKAITDQQGWILTIEDMMNRRIDQEIDRVNILHDESMKYIDSRTDKLEHKYLDQTKSKQVLKG